MNPIKPIAVTANTVTLAKADYEALLDALEEAQDLVRVTQIDADLAAGRTETMPLDRALALCDGEVPRDQVCGGDEPPRGPTPERMGS